MDQFEAARLKHAKNLERKLRTQGNEVEESQKVAEPKEERPNRDAIIEVVVKMPHRILSLTLKKRNILSNVHPNRLTKDEFAKAISNGLESLIGRVD